MPASMTIISSPYRTAIQFIPNSPTPPSGMISNTLPTLFLTLLSLDTRPATRVLDISAKWNLAGQYNTWEGPRSRAGLGPAESAREPSPFFERDSFGAAGGVNPCTFEDAARAAG